VYSRNNQGSDLYWVPADGSAPAESLLVAPGPQFAGDFTPDGRTLVYRAGGTPRSLWSIRVDSAGAPRQFLANPFNNQTPSFSPDGRWVAYVSDESGRNEVYVRPFPGPGGRWQVSLDGGAEPRWSSTGGEIFYRSGAGMMGAVVRTAPEFAVGDRAALFEGAYLGGAGVYTQYDVSRDGQAFVMVRPETESQELIVVLNWFQNLRAGRGGAGWAVER
jgi:serine/threonine-protein kinase